MEFRSRGENESIRIKRNAKIPGFANTEISWIDFREKKLKIKNLIIPVQTLGTWLESPRRQPKTFVLEF